jgi:myo-inositol-1(or 4)-monophosphatase
MTDPDTDELAAVAVEAARAGGEYLRDAFERDSDGSETGDEERAARIAGEARDRILPAIREAFPDHGIGETGTATVGGTEHRWVVDALDGEDNFAAGLPTFATLVTVLREDEPVVAVVYVPMLSDTYVARRDGGVTYDGEPTSTGSDLDGEDATIAFVVGTEAKQDPETLVLAGHLRNTLEVRTERVVESWSPTVHWALLTRGRIHGVVTYHADEPQQRAGELFATESGAGVREGEDVYVAAANDRILAELADITEPVV